MSFPELSMYIQCLKKNPIKKKASSPHRFKEKYARETSNFFCSALGLLSRQRDGSPLGLVLEEKHAEFSCMHAYSYLMDAYSGDCMMLILLY